MTVCVPDQSEGLDRLKRLCSVLSHDLNNISGIVQGYVELLRLDLEPGSECDHYLDRILQACAKLGERSRAFETFSGRRRFFMVPTRLEDILTGQADERFQLTIRNSDLQALEANPDALGQMVRELYANALEADPQGKIRVSYRQNAGRAILDVVNSGCSLNADQLEQIFDPYFTTRESGRGLGLARVYGIVSQHGGSVSGRMPADGILNMHIQLPLAQDLDSEA